MMRAPATTIVPRQRPLPDSVLVERIAALGDKTALVELDERHGMTLYAIAYSMVFDPGAADLAVADVFREVWRWAASFDARAGTVREWLADLTRTAAARATVAVVPRNGT